ncbi:MAG TPA: hypothetical protein PLS45_02615 [Bacillota bacterium]|nr:hypothetical protein [Bacillota bacterium]HPW40785.1 hypothetical protein [Bacillota bacterium]
MSSENEKNGIFRRIIGSRKPPKSSCCCNVELEEMPEENADKDNDNKSSAGKDNQCCK